MKKSFAVKGFMILALAVALCMFFARTVQSITTPKVKLVQAQSGKLEQKTSLKAQVVFPSTENFIFSEALSTSVVVQEVYVKAGFPVRKGEPLFTAVMPDYEKKMKDQRDQYDEQAGKLAKLDADNRKRKKQSERNARYNEMMDAQEALSESRIQARALAIRLNIDLPSSMDLWADAAMEDEELAAAVETALAAYAAHEEAIERYYETFSRSSLSVANEVYEYILERNAIIAKMDDIEAEMSALEAARQTLTEVCAPRDGYIATIDVKEGDTYDGKKAAFSMDDPAAPPVLRANAETLKKQIDSGSRATVKGEYDEQNTTVLETGVDTEGKRYVDLELTDKLLASRGGLYAMMSQNEYDVTITYRASATTTLLSASAVRSDDGGDYVYLVVKSGGGLMGESLKLRKQYVTVLDRSDTMVSLSDDLSQETIADKEDRALEDDIRVMEYIR